MESVLVRVATYGDCGEITLDLEENWFQETFYTVDDVMNDVCESFEFNRWDDESKRRAYESAKALYDQCVKDYKY